MTERSCTQKVFPAPEADKIAMIVLGIVNCFIPGLGLCLVSLFSTLESEKKRISNYVIALLQFLLGIFIIGWVWAIVNGIVIAVTGLKKEDVKPEQPEAKTDKIKSKSSTRSAATP